MSGVNLPTTSPSWNDQRLMDGVELTADESKLADAQTKEITKSFETLQRPVQKGDWKAANAKVADLQKQFESMSPDMKKYMYNYLQTNHGGGVNAREGHLSGQFHYYLASASRDKLLKILNPEHKVDKIKTETLNQAREKAGMEAQKNMEALSVRKDLERQLNNSTK